MSQLDVKKIMIVGFGAMTQEVIARLPTGVRVGWILAREKHHPAIQQLFGGTVKPISQIEQCNEQPDLVLECASQQAVAEYAEAVLRKNWTLALISTGALANVELQQRIERALAESRGVLQILSGAVAGMDGLAAAKEAGLSKVTYLSNKSPASWRGSPAEQLIDLDSITQPTVFFTGSAREAAQRFPANANVAATIALMGIGMDATEVKLQADPTTQKNSHFIQASGAFGELHVQLVGNPLATNPKTSTLAALSAVQACRRLVNRQQGA